MRSKIRTTTTLAAVLFAASVPALSTGAAAPPRSTSAPGGRIVGSLSDRGTGAPLAGEVALSFVSTGKIIFKHAKASKGGEFVIDGVEAGKLYLTTKLEGYAVEHQSVSLRPGETKSVKLSLVRPVSLRGIVRDPAGNPLAGASVRVLYSVDAPEPGEIRSTYQWETGETYSDARGSFVIPVHPEKELVVEASHTGFLSAISAHRRGKALGKDEAVNLPLQSGVTWSGVVKDERGNAIQGAQVRLIETGVPRQAPGFVSHALLEQQLRLSSSGTDGAFRFDQVSPTTKMVVIVHPAYKPFRQAVYLTSNKAQSPFSAVLKAQD